MNTYLNAAAATERQQQLIADAAPYQRSRTDRTVKAIRRHTRSSGISAFLKDLAAASL